MAISDVFVDYIVDLHWLGEFDRLDLLDRWILPTTWRFRAYSMGRVMRTSPKGTWRSVRYSQSPWWRDPARLMAHVYKHSGHPECPPFVVIYLTWSNTTRFGYKIVKNSHLLYEFAKIPLSGPKSRNPKQVWNSEVQVLSLVTWVSNSRKNFSFCLWFHVKTTQNEPKWQVPYHGFRLAADAAQP